MPQPESNPSLLSLSEVLARAPKDELKELVGENAFKLLERVAGASSPNALANLIVSQLGLTEALRSEPVRTLALKNLETAEAVYLCEQLGFPTIDPLKILVRANYDQILPYAQTLFSFFGADFDPLEAATPPKSRMAIPARAIDMDASQLRAFATLRQSIAIPGTDVLVRMPLGSGKIRVVANAVVDAMRSSHDGAVTIWLTDGDRLCEDAFQEMNALWQAVGTQDLTMYRAFGHHEMPDLGRVANCIIVADINRFSTIQEKDAQITEVAPRLRCIVLSDAAHAFQPRIARLLEELRVAGASNTIGISPSPSGLLQATGLQTMIKDRFPMTVLPRDEDAVDWSRRGCREISRLRSIQLPIRRRSDRENSIFATTRGKNSLRIWTATQNLSILSSMRF